MHRRDDRAVRLDAGAHLAAHIPGAQWQVLEGDDHWWWCGDAGSVAQAILSFGAVQHGADAASLYDRSSAL